jgi:4-amino-4-deoxy-L-arabinose transferase-like glycosyltransferase
MERPAIWIGAILVLTAIRLLVAAWAPLAPDEAYYWIWSRALALSYLDHPPMVAVWIRTGTAIFGDTALGIRLLGPVSAALGSWLLADAANRLLPGRGAGPMAAILLNATLLMGVGSVIMTPDTPLIFFWTAAVWSASRVPASGSASRGTPGAAIGFRWWIATGAFAGLALASKYTAIFLWVGIGAWLLLSPAMRTWLYRPAPWIASLVGGAMVLPVLIWNASHGWVGLLRQGSRINDWQPERGVQFVAELIGGQAGLVTPGLWALSLAGIVLATKRALHTREAGWVLLAVLTVPPTLFFCQHAVGDRVQGNWPAIVYPAAMIAATGLVAPVWVRLYRPAVALGLGLTALAYGQAVTHLIPIPARIDPIALRLSGWDDLAAQIDTIRRAQNAAFVAVDQYALASELTFGLSREAIVFGAESRWSLMDLPGAAMQGRDGLLVRDMRHGAQLDPALWSDATRVGEATRTGRGTSLERFNVFRVRAVRGNDPALVVLPRPGG